MRQNQGHDHGASAQPQVPGPLALAQPPVSQGASAGGFGRGGVGGGGDGGGGAGRNEGDRKRLLDEKRDAENQRRLAENQRRIDKSLSEGFSNMNSDAIEKEAISLSNFGKYLL